MQRKNNVDVFNQQSSATTNPIELQLHSQVSGKYLRTVGAIALGEGCGDSNDGGAGAGGPSLAAMNHTTSST